VAGWFLTFCTENGWVIAVYNAQFRNID